MSASIEIRDVRKAYRRGPAEVVALDRVSLDIAAGEFVALMGPSGSGKTTLLNIVAGIDHADSGRVAVGGVDLATLSDSEKTRWRARSAGYIFQFYNLIPVLTAYENVELPLLVLPLSRQARREHTMAALEAVGLLDRKDHLPRQLSGGQEQRVAIARAIVADPVILVADEPTGDLDAKSAEEILGLLKRLSEQFRKTFVMVTHDPRAAAVARRMVHLDKGVLTPAGPHEMSHPGVPG